MFNTASVLVMIQESLDMWVFYPISSNFQAYSNRFFPASSKSSHVTNFRSLQRHLVQQQFSLLSSYNASNHLGICMIRPQQKLPSIQLSVVVLVGFKNSQQFAFGDTIVAFEIRVNFTEMSYNSVEFLWLGESSNNQSGSGSLKIGTLI